MTENNALNQTTPPTKSGTWASFHWKGLVSLTNSSSLVISRLFCLEITVQYCGKEGYPTYYTKTSHFIPWIEEKIESKSWTLCFRCHSFDCILSISKYKMKWCVQNLLVIKFNFRCSSNLLLSIQWYLWELFHSWIPRFPSTQSLL